MEKIAILENDSGFSFDYQKEGFGFVKQNLEPVEVVMVNNLRSRELEELKQILSQSSYIYVNSTTVHIGQYIGMLHLLREYGNIKQVFFADWQFREFGYQSNLSIILEHSSCRRYVNDMMKINGVKFNVVYRPDGIEIKAEQITRFLFDHIVSCGVIDTKPVFEK